MLSASQSCQVAESPGVDASRFAPDVSVIIVSWNARRFLDECLQSLSRGHRRTSEVIVVDNASSDGSPEMVREKHPWVRLIDTGANLGFSKANNIGIRASRGHYVALVNSDVNVQSGCIDTLAECLDRNPDMGMVGPRVMYGDRRQQSSCRHFPTIWNNFCQAFWLNRLVPRSRWFCGEHMFYFSYDRPVDVEILVGCFILARRSAINEFGLLDEDFWMYGEDIDWCRRCGDAGWRVSFFPGAEAIHYCGGSSSNDPERFNVAQQRARLHLWRKHCGPATRAGLVLLLVAQLLMRSTASALLVCLPIRREPARDRLRAQLACLRDLFGVRPAR